MGAVWFQFRTELRAHWRGALVLILLVGIAGGAVLTALAGARRTASSFERFDDSARSADALVFYPRDLDVAAVSQIPGVDAVSRLQVMVLVPSSGRYLVAVADIDGGLFHDFERGKLLEGRFANRDAAKLVATGRRYGPDKLAQRI